MLLATILQEQAENETLNFWVGLLCIAVVVIAVIAFLSRD